MVQGIGLCILKNCVVKTNQRQAAPVLALMTRVYPSSKIGDIGVIFRKKRDQVVPFNYGYFVG